MFWIHKKFEVSAAHRLELPYDSKCSAIHGHNWKITVHAFGKTLKDGMVLDFTHIKKVVCDKLDHKLLNDIIKQPTAENLAFNIMQWVNDGLREEAHCYKVEVEEVDGSIAEYQV